MFGSVDRKAVSICVESIDKARVTKGGEKGKEKAFHPCEIHMQAGHIWDANERRAPGISSMRKLGLGSRCEASLTRGHGTGRGGESYFLGRPLAFRERRPPLRPSGHCPLAGWGGREALGIYKVRQWKWKRVFCGRLDTMRSKGEAPASGTAADSHPPSFPPPPFPIQSAANGPSPRCRLLFRVQVPLCALHRPASRRDPAPARPRHPPPTLPFVSYTARAENGSGRVFFLPSSVYGFTTLGVLGTSGGRGRGRGRGSGGLWVPSSAHSG